MSQTMAQQLGITWQEVALTVISAVGIYACMIAFSRLFGARQFSRSASYDLAFIFGLGSLVGRVVLVRTSLLNAIVGLFTLFALHAAMGWLHHHFAFVHRAALNRPVLLFAGGTVLDDNLRSTHVSRAELYQQLRLRGKASTNGVRVVILERNGDFSVILDGEPLDEESLRDVVGAERLRAG